MNTYRVFYTWEDDQGHKYNDVHYSVANYASQAVEETHQIMKAWGAVKVQIETVHRASIEAWKAVDWE